MTFNYYGRFFTIYISDNIIRKSNGAREFYIYNDVIKRSEEIKKKIERVKKWKNLN